MYIPIALILLRVFWIPLLDQRQLKCSFCRREGECGRVKLWSMWPYVCVRCLLHVVEPFPIQQAYIDRISTCKSSSPTLKSLYLHNYSTYVLFVVCYYRFRAWIRSSSLFDFCVEFCRGMIMSRYVFLNNKWTRIFEIIILKMMFFVKFYSHFESVVYSTPPSPFSSHFPPLSSINPLWISVKTRTIKCTKYVVYFKSSHSIIN